MCFCSFQCEALFGSLNCPKGVVSDSNQPIEKHLEDKCTYCIFTPAHVRADGRPGELSHIDMVLVPLWHQNQARHAIWSREKGLLEECWNQVLHALTVRLTIWLGKPCTSNFELSGSGGRAGGRWMDPDRGVDSCWVKGRQSSEPLDWWMYGIYCANALLKLGSTCGRMFEQ